MNRRNFLAVAVMATALGCSDAGTPDAGDQPAATANLVSFDVQSMKCATG